MLNLADILKDFTDNSISDIHFRSNEKIWKRINGKLLPCGEKIYSYQELQEILMPIIPNEYKADFEKNKEVDFSYEIKDFCRFRVNIYQEIEGIAACLRKLPLEVLNVNQLELSPIILELCTRKKGLILVTGPTGSGKSTTLAAMLDFINIREKGHIITIEDPIEYLFKNKSSLINQRETGKHTSSFSSALKAALREDPDVLMVGEMRDLETTSTALEVSETGHLVLSTLHTNSASSTIYRIINQFPKKKQNQIKMVIASCLLGVVSQVLVPKRGKKERTAIYEVMIMNHAIANLIRDDKIHQIDNLIKMNRNAGMITMTDAMIEAIENDQISSIDALENVPDPVALEKALFEKGLF